MTLVHRTRCPACDSTRTEKHIHEDRQTVTHFCLNCGNEWFPLNVLTRRRLEDDDD